MQIISALGYFLLTILILVTVHEFGHFYVAKKLGVKVLKFSIGFGKSLFSFQHGETEYSLSLIPLGGYVKMLDEGEGSVPENEKHRAFNRQNVYRRIAIVIAGPLANFLLAIVLYTGINMLGTEGIKAVVGSLDAGGIMEQAGLKENDELLSLNQEKPPSIAEFSKRFITYSDQTQLTVQTQNKTNLSIHTLNLLSDFLALPEQGIETYLGFKFSLPKLEPIIGKVLNNSPAKRSGLQVGDKILSINQNKIKHWQALTQAIQAHKNTPLTINILRQNKTIKLNITPQNNKIGIGAYVPDDFLDSWRVYTQKSFFDALASAGQQTYQLSVLNLKMIKKMLLGETSIKQISGPITIANYANKSAQRDLKTFCAFLALISISLGLLNLLPIPMLDGGHLLLYLIEIIKGSPVSKPTQERVAGAGVFILIALTIIALYNDLLRLF
jgi:regulator of sigma E protease